MRSNYALYRDAFFHRGKLIGLWEKKGGVYLAKPCVGEEKTLATLRELVLYLKDCHRAEATSQPVSKAEEELLENTTLL